MILAGDSARCACGRIRNTFASKVDGCFFFLRELSTIYFHDGNMISDYRSRNDARVEGD